MTDSEPGASGRFSLRTAWTHNLQTPLRRFVRTETDTAFALGVLALVGRGVPDRVRTYLLTFAVVDDVAGIAIIAWPAAATSAWPSWPLAWSSSARSSPSGGAGCASAPCTWRCGMASLAFHGAQLA